MFTTVVCLVKLECTASLLVRAEKSALGTDKQITLKRCKPMMFLDGVNDMYTTDSVTSFNHATVSNARTVSRGNYDTSITHNTTWYENKIVSDMYTVTRKQCGTVVANFFHRGDAVDYVYSQWFGEWLEGVDDADEPTHKDVEKAITVVEEHC